MKKDIFSRHEDIDKMAFMNWRIDDNHIHNIINMADGFLTAAIQLTGQALLDNSRKTADITIFPILTNVNHSIELYLKAMTWTLNEIMANGTKIEGGHDVFQIFQTLRAKIKAYGGQVTIKGFDDRMQGLHQYLDELASKIRTNKDNMDFSRYPLDQKYNPHFYVIPTGNIEIDLENLLERLTEIHQALDETANFLFHQELNHDW
ncbi:hypothetical protein [Pedobacter sp.]|jgi:hypothetical protein|uniref:hypothetical protein n=1 Tax=Pedobacter sp. TaxID=1411316 RepID=UPI002BC2634E|nr:hypothetical protein [Pedobacter sp.]HWW40837.1 hypothetical protein [Pedobacter sp.]